jgi:hypothetical protein
MSDAIKAEIKKLEDRRFQAMIHSDFNTLEGLLDDGLVYTHSTGQSDTHAEFREVQERRFQVPKDRTPDREHSGLW